MGSPRPYQFGTENPVELDLHIFPGADNTFELYEDDGETTDYQRGKYAITRFSFQGGKFTIHPAEGDLNVIPASRTYHIHLPGNPEPITFTIPPGQTHTLKVHPPKQGAE